MLKSIFSGQASDKMTGSKPSLNERLININEELKSISVETENEFLTTGKHLFDFLSICQKNTNQAEAVIDMIEDGTGLNIDAFNEAFDDAYRKAESSVDTVNQVLDGIVSYLNSLGTITDLQGILNKLSSSIRFLGTNMRIETARTDHQEFNVVTTAVESLVKQIKESSRRITSTIGVVELKLKDTTNQLGDSISSFSEFVDQKHHTLNLLLNELRESTEKTRDRSKRIHQLAKLMIPEMGNINSSLQFHDITRQQIEHVCEVIEDIITHLPKLKSATRKEKQQIYYWIHQAIKLQIAQLNQVIINTDESAKGILNHFNNISELVDQQVDVANKILADKDFFNQRMQKIYSEMGNLSKVLYSGKDLLEELANSVFDIHEEFKKISNEVIQINNIREDLDDITLNAVIKASKTGPEGKVLEVMSEKIRTLSDSAKQEINENDFQLHSIVQKSEDFQNELSNRLTQQIEVTETVREASIQSINRLIKEDESVMTTMNHVSGITRQVKRDIQHIIRSITFDEFTRKKIGKSIETMENLLESITPNFPKNYKPVESEVIPELNALIERYTMESERLVHQSILEEQNENADSDDIFWDDAPIPEQNSAPVESTEKQQPPEEDDNIELW